MWVAGPRARPRAVVNTTLRSLTFALWTDPRGNGEDGGHGGPSRGDARGGCVRGLFGESLTRSVLGLAGAPQEAGGLGESGPGGEGVAGMKPSLRKPLSC